MAELWPKQMEFLFDMFFTLDIFQEIELGPAYKVRVDGVRANLPVRLGDIRIFRAGRQIRVKTRTGVTVYWNGRHFMKSRLHMDYAGETCGLCGNFNSDPNDDLLTPEGNLVSLSFFFV